MKTNPIHIQAHPQAVGYLLSADMVIDRPIGEVFDFFSRAENLEQITPASIHFNIITPTPIEMKRGALIDYSIRLHGVPIQWRTEIESWEPPYRFTDQQLQGPYKKWFHEHSFESLGPNETLVKDRVHYIPRFGALVHKFFVKPDLMKIFTYRQDSLADIFPRRKFVQEGGGEQKTPAAMLTR